MFYPLKASTSQRIQRTRPGLWGREALCRFSSPRPGLHRFLTVHDDRVVLHRTAGGEKTNEVPVPGALLKAALPNLPNDQVRRGCCWCWWWVMLLDVGWCWLVLFLSGTCSRRWSGRRWKTLKPWSRQNHEKTWTKTLKHKKGVPNTVYCCHIKIPTMHWPHSSTLPVPGLLVVRMADHTTPPRPPPHFPSALAGRSAPGWIGACAAPVGLAVCPAPSTPWPWPGWLQPGAACWRGWCPPGWSNRPTRSPWSANPRDYQLACWGSNSPPRARVSAPCPPGHQILRMNMMNKVRWVNNPLSLNIPWHPLTTSNW